MKINEKIKIWDDVFCEQHVINLVNSISEIITSNEISEVFFIDIGANVGKVYDLLKNKINIEQVWMFEASYNLFPYLVEKYKNDNKVILNQYAINNNEDVVYFDESSIDYQILNETKQLNFGLSKIGYSSNSKKVQSKMISTIINNNSFLFDKFCFIKLDTESVDFNILKDILTIIENFNIKPLIEFEINFMLLGIDSNEAQSILDEFTKYGYNKLNLNDCYGDGVLKPTILN